MPPMFNAILSSLNHQGLKRWIFEEFHDFDCIIQYSQKIPGAITRMRYKSLAPFSMLCDWSGVTISGNFGSCGLLLIFSQIFYTIEKGERGFAKKITQVFVRTLLGKSIRGSYNTMFV